MDSINKAIPFIQFSNKGYKVTEES